MFCLTHVLAHALFDILCLANACNSLGFVWCSFFLQTVMQNQIDKKEKTEQAGANIFQNNTTSAKNVIYFVCCWYQIILNPII